MINYTSWPIILSNMNAIGLNDIRGAAFTKSSRTDEGTNGQKEKLYDLWLSMWRRKKKCTWLIIDAQFLALLKQEIIASTEK